MLERQTRFEVHDFKHLLHCTETLDRVNRYTLYDNPIFFLFPKGHQELEKFHNDLAEAFKTKPASKESIYTQQPDGHFQIGASYAHFWKEMETDNYFSVFLQDGTVGKKSPVMTFGQGGSTTQAAAQSLLSLAQFVKNSGMEAKIVSGERNTRTIHVWHINPPKAQVAKSSQKKS